MIRAAILATLVATPAIACDLRPDSAALLVGAYHVDEKAGANDGAGFETFVPGVYLGFECGAVDVRIGGHSNSVGTGSAALTFTTEALTWSIGALETGPFAGVMYQPGFEVGDTSLDWVPLIGWETTYRGVFALVLPGDGDHFDAVVSVGLRVDF